MITATAARHTVSDLQRRFRFFLTVAGYCTPPGRAQCALDLARAELWLEEHDELEVVISSDDDDDSVYCSRSEYGGAVVVAIVRPCPDHGIDCRRHTEYLASVGGILDPDADFLRVVRAELAQAAQTTIP